MSRAPAGGCPAEAPTRRVPALAAVFLVNGASIGCWLSQIARVKQELGLSEEVLGLTLLGGGSGTLLTMAVSPWLAARYGSRRLTVHSGLALGASLAAIPLATGPRTLFAALLLFGSANGGMVVGMNTKAVETERLRGRRFHSLLYGVFGLGQLLAAGAGALAAAADYPPVAPLSGCAALTAAASVIAGHRLLPDIPGRQQVSFFDPLTPLIRFTPTVMPLVAMAFSAALAESAAASWAAIYLSSSLRAPPATAAGGYVVFATVLTIGRLLGDLLADLVGTGRVLKLGGATAAVGLLLAGLTDDVRGALVAIGLAGAGLSVVIPILVRSAGRLPGLAPSVGVAVVTTTASVAVLLGPPAFGLAVAAAGFAASFAVLGAVLLPLVCMTLPTVAGRS